MGKVFELVERQPEDTLDVCPYFFWTRIGNLPLFLDFFLQNFQEIEYSFRLLSVRYVHLSHIQLLIIITDLERSFQVILTVPPFIFFLRFKFIFF